MGLPEGAALSEIYAAMQDLEAQVIHAAQKGNLSLLDASNSEVVFAMTTAAEKLPEYAAELIALVRANSK